MNGTITPINHQTGSGAVRSTDDLHLRYMGFEQRGGLRSFCYRRIIAGKPAQNYFVEADMMLFQLHQVRIQEGPALCLRLLRAGLDAAPDPPSFVPCCLTAQDLLSFLDNQVAGVDKLRNRTARATADPAGSFHQAPHH